MPGLARTSRPLTVVRVHLRVSYSMQFQAIAEILAVLRLGDEPRPTSAEQSQSVFAGGIDEENFLQIKGVGMCLICPSGDAKEFPSPQSGQSALEDEGFRAVRRGQCDSQHAPLSARCLPKANEQEIR